MNFKFNRAFDNVAKQFVIPSNEHHVCMERIDSIKIKILQKMQEIGSIFKDMILNLEETAVYIKGSSYVDFPINFNSYLQIQMPFDIVPKFKTNLFDKTPIAELYAKPLHPFVEDSRIRQDLLNYRMRIDLLEAMTTINPVTCKDGKVFELSYKQEPNSDLHTIVAMETTEAAEPEDNKIIFAFFPAIKIIRDATKPLPSTIPCSANLMYWFATPISQFNERYQYSVNLKWQSIERRDKIKAKNLLHLLIKIFRLAGVIDPDLLINLRTLILGMVNQNHEYDFLNKPLATLFVNELFYFSTIGQNPLFIQSYQKVSVEFLNNQLNELHAKFLELQLGKKKYKVDDIKALFGN